MKKNSETLFRQIDSFKELRMEQQRFHYRIKLAEKQLELKALQLKFDLSPTQLINRFASKTFSKILMKFGL